MASCGAFRKLATRALARVWTTVEDKAVCIGPAGCRRGDARARRRRRGVLDACGCARHDAADCLKVTAQPFDSVAARQGQNGAHCQ